MSIFINPLSEHNKYNFSLYQTTIFPNEHTHRYSAMDSITLSFRFRSIEFNKKRSLLFFLTLELLTGRKAIASLSSRNVQSWKIRKGRLVGCKVTLRKEALYDFIDTFILTLPRREKLHPFNITSGIPSLKIIKNQSKAASFTFRLGELVLFYPIETTMGLHQDLQYRQRTRSFSTFSIEARYFHLTAYQFPIQLLVFFCHIVPVAQLDRVSDYGSEGWEFKSFRACFYF